MTVLLRSLLFVPAIRERFIEKAPQAGADLICLDLEDSVPASEKARGRQMARDAMPHMERTGYMMSVRVNSLQSGLMEEDLDAVVIPELEAIGLPKAEAAEKPKAEAADEPKAEAADEPKAEAADEPKAKAADEPKAEAADEPKAEAAKEEKAEAGKRLSSASLVPSSESRRAAWSQGREGMQGAGAATT